MNQPEHQALSRCVGDVNDFATNRWGKESSVHRGDDAFDDLLSLDGFDELLASSLPTSVVDVIHGGELIDKCSLIVDERDRGTAVQGAIDPTKVTSAYRDGATIALRSLHHLWPPLAGFTAELERCTGLRNYAQAFLTPPGGRGLRSHIDNHDVFVMQVSGSREWWAEDLGDLTLHPGDVLYMPIGTRHRARSGGKPSIHISIAILADTYREMVGRLLRSAADWLDEPLPLPLAADPTAIARRLGEQIDAVCAHLAATDLDAAVRRQVARMVQPLPAGRGLLSSVVQTALISDDSMLRARSRDSMEVQPGYGGQVVLRTTDLLVSLPAEYETVLRRIADAETFQVGSLAELDREPREALVRELIERGFLAVCAT